MQRIQAPEDKFRVFIMASCESWLGLQRKPETETNHVHEGLGFRVAEPMRTLRCPTL